MLTKKSIDSKFLYVEKAEVDYYLKLLKGDVLELGELADSIRRKMHDDTAYFTVNAAITYSNTCEALCPICSFARKEGDSDSYVLSPEDFFEKSKRFSSLGANEIHVIGGMYSKLPLSYYLEIIESIKAADKKLNIIAFTVSECVLMSRVAKKSLEEIFYELKRVGVSALPGGGAEIFSEDIRQKISPNKLSSDEWLDAMKTAHKCGLKTNATMLYGHIESDEDVIFHLLKLRELQEKTGGFKAFVPLPFRKGNSSISAKTSATYDMKIASIARLILENFPHIRTPITHYSDRMIQVLLNFGVDDVGGTHWNEEVATSAGAMKNDRTKDFIIETIESAGFNPKLTNSNYGL